MDIIGNIEKFLELYGKTSADFLILVIGIVLCYMAWKNGKDQRESQKALQSAQVDRDKQASGRDERSDRISERLLEIQEKQIGLQSDITNAVKDMYAQNLKELSVHREALSIVGANVSSLGSNVLKAEERLTAQIGKASDEIIATSKDAWDEIIIEIRTNAKQLGEIIEKSTKIPFISTSDIKQAIPAIPVIPMEIPSSKPEIIIESEKKEV